MKKNCNRKKKSWNQSKGTNNYNMGNANKMMICIPKLRAGQYLLLFHTHYYWKLLLMWNKFLKKNLLKKQVAKTLKIQFRQRGIKLKCSINKRAILLKFTLINLIDEKYFHIFAITHHNKSTSIALFLIT